jgi:hypothetical protein
VREIFYQACEDARSDLGHNIAFFRTAHALYAWNETHKLKRDFLSSPLTPEQVIRVSVARDIISCLHDVFSNGLDDSSNVVILREVLTN